MVLILIAAGDSFPLFHLHTYTYLNSSQHPGRYVLLAPFLAISPPHPLFLATTNDPVISHVHQPSLETAFFLYRGHRWQTDVCPVCNTVISISRPLEQIALGYFSWQNWQKWFGTWQMVSVQPPQCWQVCEHSPSYFSYKTCTTVSHSAYMNKSLMHVYAFAACMKMFTARCNYTYSRRTFLVTSSAGDLLH